MPFFSLKYSYNFLILRIDKKMNNKKFKYV